ncbi:hypothetical protein SAMN05216552_105913 [Pseudoduganella namucuonensis]|uniref:Uncharacterized protein n=1 Tax=Pseudoduganella namucuonensis TaxID=1035707 RepID=A0A1I7M582_9BURK|nr:hypothetical protein SAMN05216552_105913 [Pseudoduganella namucuonensis]
MFTATDPQAKFAGDSVAPVKRPDAALRKLASKPR